MNQKLTELKKKNKPSTQLSLELATLHSQYFIEQIENQQDIELNTINQQDLVYIYTVSLYNSRIYILFK